MATTKISAKGSKKSSKPSRPKASSPAITTKDQKLEAAETALDAALDRAKALEAQNAELLGRNLSLANEMELILEDKSFAEARATLGDQEKQALQVKLEQAMSDAARYQAAFDAESNKAKLLESKVSEAQIVQLKAIVQTETFEDALDLTIRSMIKGVADLAKGTLVPQMTDLLLKQEV